MSIPKISFAEVRGSALWFRRFSVRCGRGCGTQRLPAALKRKKDVDTDYV